MLVSAYWILVRDEPYQGLGPDGLSKRNDRAHTRRLVAQLERLGHTVVLNRSPNTYDRRKPLRASSSGLRPDAVAPSCSASRTPSDDQVTTPIRCGHSRREYGTQGSCRGLIGRGRRRIPRHGAASGTSRTSAGCTDRVAHVGAGAKAALGGVEQSEAQLYAHEPSWAALTLPWVDIIAKGTQVTG